MLNLKQLPRTSEIASLVYPPPPAVQPGVFLVNLRCLPDFLSRPPNLYSVPNGETSARQIRVDRFVKR